MDANPIICGSWSASLWSGPFLLGSALLFSGIFLSDFGGSWPALFMFSFFVSFPSLTVGLGRLLFGAALFC